MKKWTWKEWVSFAVIVAFVISEIVLCFVNPIAAVWGFSGFVFGVLCTVAYIKIKNKKSEETAEG